MKLVMGSKKVVRNLSITAAVLPLVLSLAARRSYAQVTIGTYGAAVGGTIQNVSQYQNGGVNSTFATGDAPNIFFGGNVVGSTANLGLNGPTEMDAIAEYGYGATYGGQAAAAVWETVTTGTVSPGATMTLFTTGSEEVTQAAEYGASESVGIGVQVYTGSLNNEIGNASLHFAAGSESAGGYTLDSTPGYSSNDETGADTVEYYSWTGVASASFYVSSNTEYLFVMQGGASEFGDPDKVGNYTEEALLDPPTWSLTTSPGVTYTTMSGIPIGGNVSGAAAAPEPACLALMLPGALLLPIATRRMQKCTRYAANHR